MSPRSKATAKPGKATEVLIPDKLYFRIGEVAELCRLPAYVLRFWETEFRSSSRSRAAPARECIAGRMSRTFST